MTHALAICLLAAVGGGPEYVGRVFRPGGPEGPPYVRQAVATEVITEIRVHGNLIASNEEVVAIAGAAVGTPFRPELIEEVTARLHASKKFDEVQVLKRFASIDDPTRITLVILVSEGPVRLTGPLGSPSIVRRRGIHHLMVLPIIDAEDGYGLTYGARLAVASANGSRHRVSFPLTWGGMKRAGVEFERTVTREPLIRFRLGAAVQRQKNPAFLENDDRRRLWTRLEHARGPMRAGATLALQRVSFAGADDTLRSTGADLAFDTRLDPAFPRNAVYGSASWEHIRFSGRTAVNRTRLEGRAYVGLVGQSVVVVQAARESANRSLPPYLKPLLGGWSSLRGFRAGSFAGDTVVTGSIELRVPLSSPLQLARVGVSVFTDAGAAYDVGERWRDQTLRRSIGAGLWLTATVLRLGVSVAHGRGGETRVNFGGGLGF